MSEEDGIEILPLHFKLHRKLNIPKIFSSIKYDKYEALQNVFSHLLGPPLDSNIILNLFREFLDKL
jgi:hypothetical protein